MRGFSQNVSVAAIIVSALISVFFISLLFPAAESQAKDPIPTGLTQVYQLAFENDPVFKASRHKHLAAGETVKQAWSNLLPTIAAEGEYRHMSQDIEYSDNTVYGLGESDYPIQSYKITLKQPIIDYAAIVRLYQAKGEVRRADLEFEAAKQDLIMRVAERYLSVMAAEDNLAFTRAELAAVNAHFKLAQGRHGMGLAPITDLHDAKARLAMVTSTSIEAENKLDDSLQALEEITGLPVDELAGLAPGSGVAQVVEPPEPSETSTRKFETAEFRSFESLALSSPAPENVDHWVQAALKQNLSVGIQKLSAEVADREIRRQRGGHYPTLGFQGQYSWRDTEGSLYGGGSEVESAEFAVMVNVPIFQGGFVRSRTKEAIQLQKAAEAELQKQIRAAKRQARSAYLGVESAINRVRALQQSVDSHELALESKEQGFKSGLYTSMAVLDAERDLFMSKRDYAQANYDYLLYSLRLKQATGILQENDLVAIDQGLD